MMKVQLRDIVQGEGALARMFGAHPKKSSYTFKLARLSRNIRPVLDDYREARNEALKRHAVADPERPNQYYFSSVDDSGEIIRNESGEPVLNQGALDAFNAEVTDLLNEEAGIDIKPFTLAMFDQFGVEPELTPDEMASIWWLIKEAQEEGGEDATG
jgi:hypothetical protein